MCVLPRRLVQAAPRILHSMTSVGRGAEGGKHEPVHLDMKLLCRCVPSLPRPQVAPVAVDGFAGIPNTTVSCHHQQRLRAAASCRRLPPRAIPTIGRSDYLGGIVAVRKISGGKRPWSKVPGLKSPRSLRTLPRTCATGRDAVRGTTPARPRRWRPITVAVSLFLHNNVFPMLRVADHEQSRY